MGEEGAAADSSDIKGLELAGVNAFQEHDFAQAVLYFRQLYQLLPPESPYARDILAAQKEAENKLAQIGGAAPRNPASPPAADDKLAAAAPGAGIKGRIDISPAL